MGLGKHNGEDWMKPCLIALLLHGKKMGRAKPFTDLNSSHSLSRRNFISLTINHAAVLDRLDLHIPREEEAGEEGGRHIDHLWTIDEEDKLETMTRKGL